MLTGKELNKWCTKMSEIIERNREYLVKSPYGTWAFNNKQSANSLHKVLNDYETTIQQLQQITAKSINNEAKIRKLTKQIKSIKMTERILTDELNKLHRTAIK